MPPCLTLYDTEAGTKRQTNGKIADKIKSIEVFGDNNLLVSIENRGYEKYNYMSMFT